MGVILVSLAPYFLQASGLGKAGFIEDAKEKQRCTEDVLMARSTLGNNVWC